MSADLVPFAYEGQRVRTVIIDGEPWFVARDACAVLGISNGRDALSGLDDDEKGVATTDTPGGPQQVAIINEFGLYSLILRSRKPEAKAFKRWITHEVIPQIRRDGSYGSAVAAQLPSPRELAQLVILEADRADAAEAKVAELAPAAESWATLATANGDLAVADAAKILSRDPAIKIGRDRLFRVLRDLGWVYRQEIDGRHRAYQRHTDNGRLSELPSSHYHPRTGELILDPPQVRVTVKGLQELHRHLGGTGRPAIESGRGAA